ncbi:hypothetical protein ACFPYJ_28240 [Paenibacillus solisilvae]|uniref:Uncharacterized protein n=1 Tax=Paenibacillus solisilvae TaxID=2486751 RepID=A0ABW0W4D1_9BACL
MDVALFIIFSVFEGLAAFTVMLTMFRYNIREYLLQLSLFSIMMSVFSFSMRYELGLENYTPFLSLLLFVLIIFITLRISMLGAVIVVVPGYVLYAVLQTAILNVLQTLNLTTVIRVQENTSDLYFLQAVTAAAAFITCWFIFRRGFGFSWSLNRFSFQGENILVLVLLILGIAFASVYTLLKTELVFVSATFIIILVSLLYLFIRKGIDND